MRSRGVANTVPNYWPFVICSMGSISLVQIICCALPYRTDLHWTVPENCNWSVAGGWAEHVHTL